ncbi:MAG: beta-ketoacyl-[acyl-carrier-protein] synthase family protein [Acidobacteria bacterium]|nr:MAG: beta-ketoacyl-[acyl-carrier-protein] synthase family protein [Acidobacteriota bacterium]
MSGNTRVVITGMGAVSPLGTGLDAVVAALREGRSGIRLVEEWRELGFGSQVGGLPEAEPESPLLTRKIEKSSSSTARMCLRAAWEALETARLPPERIAGSDTAAIIGSGTGSSIDNFRACKVVEKAVGQARATGEPPRTVSTRRIHPFTVPRVMASTASANLSVALGLRGESWTVSSACATGAHAIGMATRLIRAGLYERVIAGASDEVDWTRAAAFDAMHALSRGFNDRPEEASRPFARDRDGFVISGGAGVLVLESLDAAMRRDAPILAEVLGFGATSDGHDIVAPLTDGAIQAMRRAIADAGLSPEEIEYVNAHGTSTPQGDPSEAAAMAAVFGGHQPWISSTKSTTGHGIGAAGALEAIYTLLMLRDGFLAPNRNVTPDTVDEACAGLRLVLEAPNAIRVRTALSNSFGFGGTNACLVLRAWDR